MPRVADVAGLGPILGNPAAMGGLEPAAELDGLGFAEVADQVRVDAEHHRGFPFAGVTHLLLLDAFVLLVRLAAEGPISGGEETEVAPFPVLLPQLKDGLLGGDDVAPVPI